MGGQGSYQNSLAVIENNKTVSKSNQKMLDKLLKLKEHEINTIAEVEKEKIKAEIQKQRIQRESKLKFTMHRLCSVKLILTC